MEVTLQTRRGSVAIPPSLGKTRLVESKKCLERSRKSPKTAQRREGKNLLIYSGKTRRVSLRTGGIRKFRRRKTLGHSQILPQYIWSIWQNTTVTDDTKALSISPGRAHLAKISEPRGGSRLTQRQSSACRLPSIIQSDQMQMPFSVIRYRHRFQLNGMRFSSSCVAAHVFRNR